MRKLPLVLIPVSGLALSCTGKSLPNVIYVFPDQMRGSALGIWQDPEFAPYAPGMGDPVVTPNLDAFARQACVLADAWSPCPVSSPHRGSLLTGMYPSRSGVPINCRSDRPYSSVREDLTCIGDVFKAAGYDCGYIGKYHADHPTPNDPQHPGSYSDKRLPAWDAYTAPERRHGFDFWYSYGTFDVHKNPHYWDSEGRRHEPHEWSPLHEAKVAASYIRGEGRHPGRPFFLMVGMNPPHSPYRSLSDCEEQDYALYAGKTPGELLVRPNADTTMAKATSAAFYFASVTGVDRAFGQILDALREAGLEDNTIVVFSSDHGETMCSHGVTDPKNLIYTEAANVPFLVRWPGHIRARVERLRLSSPDIMPTLLGMAGLRRRIPDHLHGRDLSSIFLEKGRQAARPEDALYIRNLDGAGDFQPYFPAVRGVKTDRWSFSLRIRKDGTLAATELYDDEADPFQMVNLPLEEHPEAVRELCSRLARLLREAEDPWYEKRVLSDMIPYGK